MTTSFWNSWQLWEKLCFVLAGGIVFVVFLGCMKLVYNHWKLRRYTKIDATKAAMKQEMHHSQSVERRRANRVPFGVRAIESGIEVDGVWISRSNTPASSLPGSPALSGTTFRQIAPQPDPSPGRKSTASDITRIEISPPVQGYPEANQASASSSKSRGPFDFPVRKHEPPPTSDHQPRGRATYQPRRSSGLRFSDSFDPEEHESLSTLGAHAVVTRKDGKRPEGSESELDERRPSTSWSASSSNNENGGSGQKPKSETVSDGLPYPEYHKPPKDRMSAFYELTDSGPNERQNMRRREDRQFPSFSPREGMTNAHGRRRDDVVSDGISRDSHEASNLFNAYNETRKDEHPSISSVDDDIADQHARLMHNSDNAYDRGHAQPLQPFDGNRRLRRSQVIRKINSGFEILRPGTLDAPHQSKEETEWTGDLGGANKRDSKKLVKRGRASSRSSYTLEQ